MSASGFTFNGVVRFTRIGTSYLLFTIAIGFGALNTGNNALYIALTILLGCLLLSGAASHGGLRRLQVEFAMVEEAWAGRRATGTLRIVNRSRLWNVRDVVIVSEELAEPAFVPMLTRRSAVEVRASFLFQRRGLVELERVDLYTRYPFGFFLKKRRVPIRGEVVVYPRLLDEDVARARFRDVAGEHSSVNRPGGGSEVHSFREFTRGDSIRQVYWKKSASLGRWIIKQPELEVASAVHVVVDPYKPPGVSEEEFEEMISAAATFIDRSVRSGLDVMLSLPRVTVRIREGESAGSAFRALALLEPVFEPVGQAIERGSILFAVGGHDDAATA
ncbi:MAG: DUF58 domain-containing protein [Acidobacteriota bacterium]